MMGWQWHQLNHMQAICTSLQEITTPASHSQIFYGPDALPDTQPTASKHWRPIFPDFLFNFNRNYASILHRLRDTASYLSKFADFTLPHLHLAPPLGVTPVEFRKDFWHQKTRVPGLSYGVVCVFLCLAISVELRLVTDRHTQTDGQTHDHGIYRASIASRGNKTDAANAYRFHWDNFQSSWIKSILLWTRNVCECSVLYTCSSVLVFLLLLFHLICCKLQLKI